jgi:hypothetical protein
MTAAAALHVLHMQPCGQLLLPSLSADQRGLLLFCRMLQVAGAQLGQHCAAGAAAAAAAVAECFALLLLT